MKLYVHILGHERAAQTQALVETFLRYKKGDIQVSFNILYGNNTDEWAIRDAFSFLREKYTNFNFTLYELPKKGSLNLSLFLKENNFNLILPANTIFTTFFNIDDLFYLDYEKEYLDLFKGLNRVMDQEGTFLNISSQLIKRDSLYYLKEKTELLEVHNNYGKIFYHNSIDIEEKLGLFYSISPCFINMLNKVEKVDEYDMEELRQYSLYTMGLRYLMGETIDIAKLDTFCGNKIYDTQNLTFKVNDGRVQKIHNLVGKTFYINLTRRHDRRELIDKELQRVGISAERQEGFDVSEEELDQYIEKYSWTGVDNRTQTKARVGCTKSHLEVVKKAKDNNLDSVLIMEDDCKFIKDPHTSLFNALKDLKRFPECDILFLGANALDTIQPLTPNLGKLNALYCAHAYVVFKRAFDYILDYEWKQYRVIDELYMNMSRDSRFNLYTALPVAAVQQASFSDIEQKDVDYTNVIVRSYKTNLK